MSFRWAWRLRGLIEPRRAENRNERSIPGSAGLASARPRGESGRHEPGKEGEVKCAPIVTGTVGLNGVDNAFTALKDPEKHAKILIDPSSAAAAPVS